MTRSIITSKSYNTQNFISSNSCSDDYKLSLYDSNMSEEFKDRLIRLLNAKNGGNQSALAKSIGIEAQAVQQWISGKTKPKGKNLEKAAQFLDVTPAQLLFGDDNVSFTNHERNGNKVTKLNPKKKGVADRAEKILNIISRFRDMPDEDLDRLDIFSADLNNKPTKNKSIRKRIINKEENKDSGE
ncbi:MAG: helix-turn-helix domain-containing protein [Nitrosomonas sp.]|nr:helix-turn-helix domain-containing protein [Nitrosomonas sp.]